MKQRYAVKPITNPAFAHAGSRTADHDPSTTEFTAMLDTPLSRRRFLHRSSALGFAAWVSSVGLPQTSTAGAGDWLEFTPVAANRRDTVTVPHGFSWHVVASVGDPLWRHTAAFDPVTRGDAASQQRAFGDHADGMEMFHIDGHSVIAINHESISVQALFPSGKLLTADDVKKGKAAHGISIVEITQRRGRWSVVKDSPYNRRITPDTPMTIAGPARGHAWLQTAADPAATHTLGTWNNCGSGRTPWGTYLTCEENFDNYFSISDPTLTISAARRRYGFKHHDQGYAWAAVDSRFDLAKHPNEANRCGYVVEIDPVDAHSTPKKLTALGRLKHENAELVIADNNRVVVYLGDDERGEYLYRFVSSGTYRGDQRDRDLLDSGTLYAARFDAAGRGEWLELSPAATGLRSAAEICIHTRMAASAVAATTMDRPEWVASNPHQAEVYCALTNNKHRGKKTNTGGDKMPLGGPNPRLKNRYGQIVRWRPDNGDHSAAGFAWDLFVVAGNPAIHSDDRKGSPNINIHNMFNSPDGLAFDSHGGLWIQTDGNFSNQGNYAGHGNNQMLFANPASGAIKRFMVGPNGCEITGLCWSFDRKTMFVNIQHPGALVDSHFPAGGNTPPRSSLIAITRDDGGAMG